MPDKCKTLNPDLQMDLEATVLEGSGEGCEDFTNALKWQMGNAGEPDGWTDGTNKVYYDDATGTYVLDAGDGVKRPLTYRCEPDFRAVALGVKLGDDDCKYDLEITQ